MALSRASRLWKLLAAFLPAAFPLLVGSIALRSWLTPARIQPSIGWEWMGTWLAVVMPLALWLLAVAPSAAEVIQADSFWTIDHMLGFFHPELVLETTSASQTGGGSHGAVDCH
jgi:hypothetical protein